MLEIIKKISRHAIASWGSFGLTLFRVKAPEVPPRDMAQAVRQHEHLAKLTPIFTKCKGSTN